MIGTADVVDKVGDKIVNKSFRSEPQSPYLRLRIRSLEEVERELANRDPRLPHRPIAERRLAKV